MNKLTLIWDEKEAVSDARIPGKVKGLLFLCLQLDTTAYIGNCMLFDALRVERKNGILKELCIFVKGIRYEVDEHGRMEHWTPELLASEHYLMQLL